MGMTYADLSFFGRLRKVEKCGPFAMLCVSFPVCSQSVTDMYDSTKLAAEWSNVLSPVEVG